MVPLLRPKSLVKRTYPCQVAFKAKNVVLGDSPVEIRADLVWLAVTEGVALRTSGLEQASTLRGVTYSTKQLR